MLIERLQLIVDGGGPRARVKKTDDMNILIGSKGSLCKSLGKP